MDNTTEQQAKSFDHSKQCVFDAVGKSKKKFTAKVTSWNQKVIQNGGFDTISEAIEEKMKHFTKKELAILLVHPGYRTDLCSKHAAAMTLLADILGRKN